MTLTAGRAGSGSGDLLDVVGPWDVHDAMEPRLQSLAFEGLAQGITDTRMVALLHVLGWQDGTSSFGIAGMPRYGIGTAAESVRAAIADLGGRNAFIGSHEGNCVALVAVQGAVTPQVLCTAVDAVFAAGAPVCVTPVRSGVQGASQSIRSAVSTLRVAPAINPLPRPLHAEEVLPERALMGDEDARNELYTSVYASLKSQGDEDPMLETVSRFLNSGRSLDVTARELSVHPNTVRYRLKRAAQTTGWDATDPREAYVLHTAIIIGNIQDARTGGNPVPGI